MMAARWEKELLEEEEMEPMSEEVEEQEDQEM